MSKTTILLMFTLSLHLLLSFSTAEIKNVQITSDTRPMILFEKFGFTHFGHVKLKVSVKDFSFTSTLSQPDPSRLGFFLLSDEALIQVLIESETNSNFCVLDSRYTQNLFTFKELVSNNSFNQSYPVSVSALNEYSLFFANCQAETQVTMTVRTEIYNLDGNEKDYLSAVLLEIQCSSYRFQRGHVLMENTERALLPATSPSNEPQPFLPLQSPPPLIPFTNNSVPRLSGLCLLNFSTAESMMPVTAHDCFGYFAPYLANVMCCPQLEATVSILIGQSSKYTRNLALDKTQAKHCLSDLEQILASQGAANDLQKICSIHPSNLTEGSCPVTDVMQLESTIDSPTLLTACEKIDPVNECCTQICQNAILEVAQTLAAKNIAGLVSKDGVLALPEHLSRIDDCRSIVLRWIASKLDPLPAKKVLRGLSNCKLNKACPLKLPDINNVAKDCANGISNKTVCCSSMKTYVSRLQYQSFVTNLQALDCAAMFGMRLQKANITANVYDICHISLKDFSVQVGSQESGCLLPSLPTDATLDVSTISFVCDLNDNIAAPWPSKAQVPSSSCKTIKFPALPAATSGQGGHYRNNSMFLSLLASLVSLTTLLQLCTSCLVL